MELNLMIYVLLHVVQHYFDVLHWILKVPIWLYNGFNNEVAIPVCVECASV